LGEYDNIRRFDASFMIKLQLYSIENSQFLPEMTFFSFQKIDEETTALRERIISIRRKVHKITVSAVADRWNFEEGVSGTENI
jgi:hypothetical protein